MEAATTTAPVAAARPATRGLPPGPPLPAQLQTAIWSRQARRMLVRLPRALRQHLHDQDRPRRDLGDALRPGGRQAGLHRRPARLPRRRGEPDPRAGPRPELGPGPRRESPHRPAPAAAAAVPRRADAGLPPDDGRDRRPRDRELADRSPLRPAAADAGDHPRHHPQHGLRRRRGGEDGRAARRPAPLPRPDDESPRSSCRSFCSGPSGRRRWAGSGAGSRRSTG